jgi:NADPH:quinone reductase-like Zn-dependent oxidoreductase
MRALVYEVYGAPEVVRVDEVPAPTAGPGQVLVQVHTTTVNSGDARLRAARFPPGMAFLARLALGWSAPRTRVLGAEVAGVVVAVGGGVSTFAVGDRVVGMTGMRMGGHAELALLDADRGVARLPDEVGFREAIGLPFGGLTAMSFLARRAAVAPGERVLVVGASGAVGVAAVQVAKRRGAHVTAVCSGANEALVRSLGADAVVDYTRAAPTGVWDVVLDTVGATPVATLRSWLTPRGRLVLIAAGIPQMLWGAWVSWTSGQRVFTGISDESPADLRQLLEWHVRGEYQAVVDRELPLAEGAAAHALVDGSHKRGAVVLRVAAG